MPVFWFLDWNIQHHRCTNAACNTIITPFDCNITSNCTWSSLGSVCLDKGLDISVIFWCLNARSVGPGVQCAELFSEYSCALLPGCTFDSFLYRCYNSSLLHVIDYVRADEFFPGTPLDCNSYSTQTACASVSSRCEFDTKAQNGYCKAIGMLSALSFLAWV
jgi:hypothetical protein